MLAMDHRSRGERHELDCIVSEVVVTEIDC